MIIVVNFQLKQLERRSLRKNQGFNGIQTSDLRDTGAMLYQLSYEATHWERGQLVEFISPVRSEMACAQSVDQYLADRDTTYSKHDPSFL